MRHHFMGCDTVRVRVQDLFGGLQGVLWVGAEFDLRFGQKRRSAGRPKNLP
jgi:uncharacterized membrane protein